MFIDIKDILDNSLGKNRKGSATANNAFDFIELINCWESIIGPLVYKHTRPLKLSKKKLTIVCGHSAFAHQLGYLKQDIIDKITKKFPELNQRLREIQFEVNSELFQLKSQGANLANESKQETRLHPLSPQYKELKKLAIDEVDLYFSQSEFRELFISLYLQILIDDQES